VIGPFCRPCGKFVHEKTQRESLVRLARLQGKTDAPHQSTRAHLRTGGKGNSNMSIRSYSALENGCRMCTAIVDMIALVKPPTNPAHPPNGTDPVATFGPVTRMTETYYCFSTTVLKDEYGIEDPAACGYQVFMQNVDGELVQMVKLKAAEVSRLRP